MGDLARPGMAPELKAAIEEFITANKVVCFIKGTKQFPQCGFSNTVVQVRLPGGNVPCELIFSLNFLFLIISVQTN